MTAPDDPIGTVRATEGVLAVRAPSSSIRPDVDDELSWFIIDIGGAKELFDMDFEEVEDLIDTWPIVYQPGSITQVSYDGDVVAIFPG